MPPRKNPNIESITEEYIDGAVKVHVKASEVPPRQNLNISFKDADMLGDEVTLSNQEAYEESHGKIYEMTHNNTVPWRNWAFYLILVSMLTVCFTFAKYASFASGDAQAAVAKFDIVVTGSASQETEVTVKDFVNPTDSSDGNITNIFKENTAAGATETITFEVANNSDVTTKITDVHFVNSPQHSYTLAPKNGYGTGSQTNGPLSAANFNDIPVGGKSEFTLTFTKNATELVETGKTLSITIEQVD